MKAFFVVLLGVGVSFGCASDKNQESLGQVNGSKKNYATLLDGSTTWSQPETSGVEGYCGQTSGANLIAVHDNKLISPDSLIPLASDSTPGTRPRTLVAILNQAKNTYGLSTTYRWNHERGTTSSQRRLRIFELVSGHLDGEYTSTQGFLRKKGVERVRRYPFAALVTMNHSYWANNRSLELHWITVVDVENYSKTDECQVTFNHHRMQRRMPCSTFLSIWNAAPGLSYTYVRAE